ncbi:stage II sporulation protein E [Knoellia remsis]|uniref:Stage II sporulation protein E n=1 Tax=Knoellia remsis TaxID=407159 RepID=A0A2T0UEL7_9MICO|nr:PP2C family protein-serine/threonine phosphatase [Knoellia remsis]PRY56342.1 stage II sporulation protein E [Knoellia remsis]
MATDLSVLSRRDPTTLTRRLGPVVASAGPRRDRLVFSLLVLLAFVFVLAVVAWPTRVPLVALAPFILLSGLYLPHRHLVALYIIIVVGLCTAAPRLPMGVTAVTLTAASLCALMVMMVIVASSRVRVGSTGFHGENLFVDLRDRIARAATLPGLPSGWTAESEVHSAYGEGFSGDFMVADRTHDGRHLEVALVDVSGKGREAGTRSMLLCGALGALLGSLPPREFLDAANTYLVRQGWEEGFATAVHVDINLDTGEFSVGNAGHPSAAHYDVGSGTWEVLEGGRGPVLGIMHGVSFTRTHGTLDMGDALMIYSDGIIESRGHDLTEGTDRMLGAASDAIVRASGSVAEAVVSSARSGEDDDRAVFVITRR